MPLCHCSENCNPLFPLEALGRYRRFPQAIDDEQLKRFERQAKNFPIQGLVADVVNQAVYHICRLRDQWGLKSKLVLQIHDAIILEVPEAEVSHCF